MQPSNIVPMNSPTPQPPLPKWIVGDDADWDAPRSFVIHTHFPRFILEFDDSGSATNPHWLDPQQEIIRLELAAGRQPAQLIARLMREAAEFFLHSLEQLED